MLQLGGIVSSLNNATSNSLNPSGRRNPSGDTPKGHTNFMAPPSGSNKGNFSVQHHSQLPSIEVTPTSGTLLQGGAPIIQHHQISKHNSFYDECLRLNAGNTTVMTTAAVTG